MLKTLVITRSKDFQIHIEGELRGQELYEAYVAMTGYIAGQFKNSNNIHQMAQIAVNDALRLLGEKRQAAKNTGYIVNVLSS